MQKPEENVLIEREAARIIRDLDLIFPRYEVRKIAEWVAYLSTQE